MNEHSTYLVQAIRGPVILITIGVLFAFDRFTEFRFSQTWPVLLIVVGLLRLVGGPRRRYREYAAQGPGPYAPPVQDAPSYIPPDPQARRYAETEYRQPPGPQNPESRP